MHSYSVSSEKQDNECILCKMLLMKHYSVLFFFFFQLCCKESVLALPAPSLAITGTNAWCYGCSKPPPQCIYTVFSLAEKPWVIPTMTCWSRKCCRCQHVLSLGRKRLLACTRTLSLVNSPVSVAQVLAEGPIYGLICFPLSFHWNKHLLLTLGRKRGNRCYSGHVLLLNKYVQEEQKPD